MKTRLYVAVFGAISIAFLMFYFHGGSNQEHLNTAPRQWDATNPTQHVEGVLTHDPGPTASQKSTDSHPQLVNTRPEVKLRHIGLVQDPHLLDSRQPTATNNFTTAASQMTSLSSSSLSATDVTSARRRQDVEKARDVAETQHDSETSRQVPNGCKPGSKARKIFLFTYMRGGSSLLGDVFNRDPKVMYWYEVADSFYMSKYGLPVWTFPQDILYGRNGSVRNIPGSEHEALASFFNDVFSCRVRNLPVETLLHQGLSSEASHSGGFYYRSVSHINGHGCGSYVHSLCGGSVPDSIEGQCPERLKQAADCSGGASASGGCGGTLQDRFHSIYTRVFEEHQRCLETQRRELSPYMGLLRDACCGADIRVAKVHRLTMGSMEALIRQVPDVKIVYYVRDPRGIAISRQNTPHNKKGTLLWTGSDSSIGTDTDGTGAIKEARLLCSRMLKDFQQARELQRKHPESLIMAKYEELVQNPHQFLDTVFAFLGEQVDQGSMAWLLSNMHAGQSGSAYETSRVNATATAHAWRSTITRRQGRQMLKDCQPLLELLGYEL